MTEYAGFEPELTCSCGWAGDHDQLHRVCGEDEIGQCPQCWKDGQDLEEK